MRDKRKTRLRTCWFSFFAFKNLMKKARKLVELLKVSERKMKEELQEYQQEANNTQKSIKYIT